MLSKKSKKQSIPQTVELSRFPNVLLSVNDICCRETRVWPIRFVWDEKEKKTACSWSTHVELVLHISIGLHHHVSAVAYNSMQTTCKTSDRLCPMSFELLSFTKVDTLGQVTDKACKQKMLKETFCSVLDSEVLSSYDQRSLLVLFLGLGVLLTILPRRDFNFWYRSKRVSSLPLSSRCLQQ